MAKYIEQFKSKDDICTQYEIDSKELRGAKIIVAWYGYGSYCGSSLVIFERGGKLYEVNGSHCSCYGLEGQWSPEETSWEALAKRNLDGSSGYYDGEAEANEALKKIVRRKMKAAVIA